MLSVSDKLRSPICCIMGHVDTGKTSLLDNIRRTNVQGGEAGGITQQIGATFFDKDTLLKRTEVMHTQELDESLKLDDLKLPGLLIIDTPGHEAFSNLRSRGSGLCDIAILVIDLMHGIEQQTRESIKLLRKRKTPFVVAMNKVDRLYGWKSTKDGASIHSLKAQDDIQQFNELTSEIKVQLAEEGINSALYWENTDVIDWANDDLTVSLVPTSAHTGEGIPDLLQLLAKLTQQYMSEALRLKQYLQCTILEINVIEGLGTTLDVILVNGTLHEGDRICVATKNGPQITTIRALLTPPPCRETRVKSEYIHHERVEAAMGIKLSLTDNLEDAMAGTGIMLVGEDDNENDIMEEVLKETQISNIELEEKGVLVQASTIGALEALCQHLKEECKPPVPIAATGIGPIFKRDVMKASIMNQSKAKEYSAILAFNVRVDQEAHERAQKEGVQIFTAEIIYHLGNAYQKFYNEVLEERKQQAMGLAVFPVVLEILKDNIFNYKNPIIIGVKVKEGTLRTGTPLAIPFKGGMHVGRVTGIEINHRNVEKLKKGMEAAISIDADNITYGRQFDHNDTLYSEISRASIDALKEYFRSDLDKSEWKLVAKLKPLFGIP